MTVTQEDSGTLGTGDHTVGTDLSTATVLGTSPTTAGIRELVVDLNNLGLGELVTLIVEEKVLSGGTARRYLIESFRGGRTDPIVKTTPVASPHGCVFKLKQTDGTVRAFDWAFRKIDG